LLTTSKASFELLFEVGEKGSTPIPGHLPLHFSLLTIPKPSTAFTIFVSLWSPGINIFNTRVFQRKKIADFEPRI
jgi:hypothetical protein